MKLPRLPDRKPVKLTIVMMPELYERLQDYAAAYAQTYGAEEPIGELIPAILGKFIESDRRFAARSRRRTGRGGGDGSR